MYISFIHFCYLYTDGRRVLPSALCCESVWELKQYSLHWGSPSKILQTEKNVRSDALLSRFTFTSIVNDSAGVCLDRCLRTYCVRSVGGKEWMDGDGQKGHQRMLLSLAKVWMKTYNIQHIGGGGCNMWMWYVIWLVNPNRNQGGAWLIDFALNIIICCEERNFRRTVAACYKFQTTFQGNGIGDCIRFFTSFFTQMVELHSDRAPRRCSVYTGFKKTWTTFVSSNFASPSFWIKQSIAYKDELTTN